MLLLMLFSRIIVTAEIVYVIAANHQSFTMPITQCIHSKNCNRRNKKSIECSAISTVTSATSHNTGEVHVCRFDCNYLQQQAAHNQYHLWITSKRAALLKYARDTNDPLLTSEVYRGDKQCLALQGVLVSQLPSDLSTSEYESVIVQHELDWNPPPHRQASVSVKSSNCDTPTAVKSSTDTDTSAVKSSNSDYICLLHVLTSRQSSRLGAQCQELASLKSANAELQSQNAELRHEIESLKSVIRCDGCGGHLYRWAMVSHRCPAAFACEWCGEMVVMRYQHSLTCGGNGKKKKVK